MKKKLFFAFFLFGIVLLIIKYFFFDILVIPSNSMLPTLFPGDYVIISRFKVAERGDLIIFRRNKDFYIKRVIAKQNETFSYLDDKVYINEEAFIYYESQVKKKLPVDINKRKFRSFSEASRINSFPGFDYQILIDKDKMTRNLINVVVPEYSYFVLGDNRNHSLDSRDFGAVNFNDVIGTAIYWW